MKRRFIAMALIAIMAMTLLAGCGGSSASKETSGGASSAQTSAPETTAADGDAAGQQEAGGWSGEVSHIVMTYLTLGNTPADLDKVVEAVNAITVPNIGVEVEFRTCAIFDTNSQYSLWISGGEQVDLMMIPFANVATYADQGLIEPLDALIDENAPYIKSCMEEGYPLVDGTYYMGEAYGIAPVMYSYGVGGGLVIPNQYIEEAGLEIGEEPLGLDGVDAIYAQLKEKYPDKYPCGVITSGRAGSTIYMYFGGVFDALGATPSSGVLVGTDSTTVENLFASEGYYEYVKKMNEWYNKGYVYPDATTTNSTANELTKSGVLLTESITNQPVMVSDMASSISMECTGFDVGASYYTSQSSSGGTYWTIPITSANPAAAMRFLDYTFSNHDLHNLILWGIEGEHFVVVDKDNFLIGFPEGVDGSTSGYFNTLGLYGDRRYEYVWDAANSKEANAAYTQEAMANPTKGVGYAYDTTQMASMIANVDAVLTQYLPTLESGSAADFESLYQEFLSALEAAGINDIIADNQAQFDQWLAQQ